MTIRLRPLLLALLITASGCVEKLSIEYRPCPCLDGYQCCGQTSICIPINEICPGGLPCSPYCERGQYCHEDTCQQCYDNKHCGIQCVDCTDQLENWACVQGSCGCRVREDCPGRLECLNGVCGIEQPDGGPPDGGSGDAGGDTGSGSDGGGFDAGGDMGYDAGYDAGEGDAGPTDGGQSDAEDGGTTDGDDGGPVCYTNNNKNCGPGCTDCTRQEENWACVNGRCGCLDQADCPPDLVCEYSLCRSP